MSASLTLVTVFTGSSEGSSPAYRAAAENVGKTLAGEGVGVVYGGGDVGLMGAVATAARGAGAEVIGVIPRVLVDKEIANDDLTRLEVVDNMHERKMRMAELGDAFVALPGGIGTLEELFEVWTWLQLGIHAKPVALFDVNGFWEPLLALVDTLVREGFVDARFREGLIVTTTPEDLLAQLRGWTPPTPKWTQSAATT
ncbi:TIGR00730 family Rossman fold protein [Microbacterium amylolyticum]|uniref:Cytokinin riboside 5'-monophosphate phosphoribohydrolase n=1 Tax=Microbacterium amylolyticum TaxID=936337 RepID=A0ABS4ZI51_9MICO|nr:TIGR00730 family Rossman fold protein [Microbacterium amylolyticum]MBP2436954.1 uncharacterized protein (TIGR00730 family) [Microbacterium amylolyticum]